jgi:hypothetical protein
MLNAGPAKGAQQLKAMTSAAKTTKARSVTSFSGILASFYGSLSAPQRPVGR